MTTKTKKTFKQSMQETGQKVKSYAGKKYNQAKTYGKKYGSDIRTAYDVGFAQGWDDAYNVPNRLVCRTAAAYGYRKGIKAHYKSDKYQKQYQRRGQK